MVFSGERKETGGGITALYPYNGTAALRSGVLSTAAPSVQELREDGIAPGSALLLATAPKAGESLAFRWLNAFVRLDVEGYAEVRKLVFSGLGGENVCGPAFIDLRGDIPSVTFSGNGAGKEITLQDEAPVTVAGKRSFWFCIPAISYPEGYGITVTYSDGREQTVCLGPSAVAPAGSVRVLGMTVDHPEVLELDFAGETFPLRPEGSFTVPESTVTSTWTGSNGQAPSKDGHITPEEGDAFSLSFMGRTLEMRIGASVHHWVESSEYYQAGYYWKKGSFLRFQSDNCWIMFPAVPGMTLTAVEIALSNTASKSFRFVEDLGAAMDESPVVFPAGDSFKASLAGLHPGVPCHMYGYSSFNAQISKMVLFYERAE